MFKVERVSVMNIENAIRGIRNSWDSHNKSDSTDTYIGESDLKLAKKLIKAGASHAKFMRQILVSADITLPLYAWKQMDQYKVGVTTNSESTMHTINRTGFWDENGCLKEEMFSFDYDFLNNADIFTEYSNYTMCDFISHLEHLRVRYNETKDKRYWDLLIALLPSGFNQMRTTTMNYAVLANIYHDRKNHRLKEWHDMCDWIETLPYSELITGKVVNE